MDRSRRPRPTTMKPMTEPAENATRRPRLRPSLAALAVRALAAVAIFIPIKPERPEKKPPVIKAKGTNGVIKSVEKPRTRRIRNIAAKKIPTIIYCRFKYALAPLRMFIAMPAILSEPSENLSTRAAIITANRIASTAPTGVRNMRSITFATPLTERMPLNDGIQRLCSISVRGGRAEPAAANE